MLKKVARTGFSRKIIIICLFLMPFVSNAQGTATKSQDNPEARPSVITVAMQKEQIPSPPGRLVDIGGYRLHIWCTGKESNLPSVVLLAGSGDFSFTWGLVQPEVSRFTRVCSYDKAFTAWSDPGPLPRTMKQEAYELRLLLQNVNIKGPYVLVGASIGGLLARVFTREYRGDVAGMVLVGSTDPDTTLGRMINGKMVNFSVRKESKGRLVPPVQTLKSSPPGAPSDEEREETEKYYKWLGTPKINSPNDRLPANLQKLDLWARFHFNPLLAKSGNPFDPEEFQALYEEAQRETPPLDDLPLIVLVGGGKARKVGESLQSKPPTDISAEERNRVTEENRLRKIAQALLSRNGKYIVIESGHEIHLYQPSWVVDTFHHYYPHLHTFEAST